MENREGAEMISFDADSTGISLTLSRRPRGFLSRLRGTKQASFDQLEPEERPLAFALAEVEALADETGEQILIDGATLHLPHRLAAKLPGDTANILGLPEIVHYTLRCDAEGSIGSSGFRLTVQWWHRGRRQLPRRKGAILHTGDGPRLIPYWMLDAIAAAETPSLGTGDEAVDWEALAKFRAALEPAIGHVDTGFMASDTKGTDPSRAALSEFLKGIEVGITDQMSLTPRGEADFEVLPFARRKVEDLDAGQPGEADAELKGGDLSEFQSRVRRQGALSAYRIGRGRYLVIDRSAQPALRAMVEAQRGDAESRASFLRNPRPAISRAVEDSLREAGLLEDLSDEGIAEAIESAAEPLFIETAEYSERVLGVRRFEKPNVPGGPPRGTTWMPETPHEIEDQLRAKDAKGLQRVASALRNAIQNGDEVASVDDLDIPATPEWLTKVEERLRELEGPDDRDDSDGGANERDSTDRQPPIVIDTLDNLETLNWDPEWRERSCSGAVDPTGLVTSLRTHQRSAFEWQVAAWVAGAPGVLNADEQGLGKTLETLSFLRWLCDLQEPPENSGGPTLVVAPTSLLRTWQAEAEQHLEGGGLGTLLRLYGSSLRDLRSKAGRGTETATGEEQLDLTPLHGAIEAGRGRDWWMITTYETLINYQHSLARIPFSVAVFDEIQAIKNPATQRHAAARAIKADFRIGLTGTPIENATSELWAIMDVLAPGALGSLSDFNRRFGTPDEANMARLHAALFRQGEGGRPPLALRRLKEEVATDLPSKTRILHPREMPAQQALAYEAARSSLLEPARGSALKMLHHIRGVSLHPHRDENPDTEQYFFASARLSRAIEILRDIRERGERALLFLEDRRMQYYLARLLSSELGLGKIDIINGQTPIDQRRSIVQHFQRHLDRDEGFDLLILSPRAAGTGLTLTAAQHVIHLSRWWNPAVEEQCNDRVHRIGQDREVTIHVPMAVHPSFGPLSFDCNLQALMMRKRKMARAALWPMGDTREDASGLIDSLANDEGPISSGTAVEAVEEVLRRDPPEGSWEKRGDSFILP